MRIGYNTNGLAHHDGLQAIELLADIGYRSIAITVDHHLLNPNNDRQRIQRLAIRRLFDDVTLFVIHFEELGCLRHRNCTCQAATFFDVEVSGNVLRIPSDHLLRVVGLIQLGYQYCFIPKGR